MKKLEPFAVRTEHLTDEQLADMFLLAEKAGAKIRSGNEELVHRNRDVRDLCDLNNHELAGADFDLETMLLDDIDDFISEEPAHGFQLFVSYEGACEYLNSIIESQNGEPAKLEIDFANTKLYTKDKELIRKYADLCGSSEILDVHSSECIGAFCEKVGRVYFFQNNSPVDTEKHGCEGVTTVTPYQVEAEYAKRFDFSAPNANKIQPHPKGIEYNRAGDSEILWVDEHCVYRREGELIEVVLAGEDELPALQDILSKMRGLSV